MQGLMHPDAAKTNCIARCCARVVWVYSLVMNLSRVCLLFVLLVLLAGVCPSGNSLALDIVRVTSPRSDQDKRRIYSTTLLEMILESTREDFGEYRIRFFPEDCTRARELHEIASGENINVCVVPTSSEWESKAIAIRIPVMKGLMGYRLFLVDRAKAGQFTELRTLEDFKKLRAGYGCRWPITAVLHKQGFCIVGSNGYEELFHMLRANRFDYFARGLNDIFMEYETRPGLAEDVVIEGGHAMYLAMPVYIFVSPAYPEVASRLRAGFERIMADGSFDRLFARYHCTSLLKARLGERHIFVVDNPDLSPETPLHDPALWVDPFDPTELCD